MSEGRIPAIVLGATGVVGQRFVRRLAAHPRFEILALAASEKNVGLAYADACDWRLDGERYAGFGGMKLVAATAEAARSARVVFSALEAGPAREIEPAFAKGGAWVFSNASAFRMAPDVPLLIPEVNGDHLDAALIEAQRRARGFSGAIVCNPNCTATVLTMALAPLHRAFGVKQVLMTSMQAASGAGYPGVPSLDILGNVIPYIGNEEPKVEEETPKMLGGLAAGGATIAAASFVVSALCNRVPVLDGHTESISVRLEGDPSPEDAIRVWREWNPEPQRLRLPSAPATPILVHDAPERPQPRRDVEFENGMTVHVGRVRRCPILGLKFTALGHNTERGAAGGSILNAELAVAKGLLR